VGLLDEGQEFFWQRGHEGVPRLPHVLQDAAVQRQRQQQWWRAGAHICSVSHRNSGHVNDSIATCAVPME